MYEASQAGRGTIDEVRYVRSVANVRVGLITIRSKGNGHVRQRGVVGQEGGRWVRGQPCPCTVLAIVTNLTISPDCTSGGGLTKDTFPVKELLEMTKSRAVAIAYTVSEDKIYD